VDSAATGCTRSKGRLLASADTENLHTTAASTIRPTIEAPSFLAPADSESALTARAEGAKSDQCSSLQPCDRSRSFQRQLGRAPVLRAALSRANMNIQRVITQVNLMFCSYQGANKGNRPSDRTTLRRRHLEPFPLCPDHPIFQLQWPVIRRNRRDGHGLGHSLFIHTALRPGNLRQNVTY
jgi:hypothetical protein